MLSSLSLITLYGGQDLVPLDRQSLFFPGLQRSEIFGCLAGLGTTFAAVPEFGQNAQTSVARWYVPNDGAIMGSFQILRVYYEILIASRPVIVWNVVGVFYQFPDGRGLPLFRP